MKRRVSLSVKILLLAFLNVSLLAFVFGAFVHFQLRFELGSFLLGPARDRIIGVSRALALELPDAPTTSWNQILTRYSNSYPAKFYLFSHDGSQLAGDAVTLPADIVRSLGEGRFRHWHPGADGPPPDGPPGPGPGRAPSFMNVARSSNPSEYWVAVHVPIWFRQVREPLLCSLVWRFDSLWTQPFFFDVRPWLSVVLAVIVISTLCWLPFVRGLKKSITQLTHATGRIAEGRFDIEVKVRRSDELGWLSESINRMSHRLSGFVNGQRRFLGDIAHELCTPIARVQMALGILEQRAGEDQAQYVADLQEEVQHMSSLVNELLLFSKAQLTSTTELSKVNVAETVQRVLQREATSDVAIETDVSQSIDVIAHPDCLFRSLANIVRNAIRYAGSAGPITVTAKNGGRIVSITVSDNGPGIPESEIDEVFKPFYRPEFARQRETGGVGLGLAIVKSCVEACGGVVMCRNRATSGFEVEIQLTAA